MSTASVVRVRAKSGNRDNDYFQPVCDCGWAGGLYSNRTIAGPRLAQRDADQHRCKAGAQ
jgi:hypothetical protein